MRRAVSALAVLLLVPLAVGLTRVGEEPSLPHAFMDDESRCIGCHRMEKDGEDWWLDPHLFTISIVEACRRCHPEEQLGRSHPVNVDPEEAPGLHRVPGELPLQWSDEARAEVMTCGTCHNPHLPRFASAKLYSRQRIHPDADGTLYLTYYLRIKGDTPREGFTPLCHTCHPDL